MRITAVEEYGLRCLLVLARKGQKSQISISEIAEIEGLSVPYASKLLALLRKAGFVKAARGRTGGFSIARDPREINLYDVLTSLGGPLIDPSHCQKFAGQLDSCVHLDNCTVHDVLGGLAGYIQEFLSKTTLSTLASESALHTSESQVVLSRDALTEELNKELE
jgi:Rrf2 family protein